MYDSPKGLLNCIQVIFFHALRFLSLRIETPLLSVSDPFKTLLTWLKDDLSQFKTLVQVRDRFATVS